MQCDLFMERKFSYNGFSSCRCTLQFYGPEIGLDWHQYSIANTYAAYIYHTHIQHALHMYSTMYCNVYICMYLCIYLIVGQDEHLVILYSMHCSQHGLVFSISDTYLSEDCPIFIERCLSFSLLVCIYIYMCVCMYINN